MASEPVTLSENWFWGLSAWTLFVSMASYFIGHRIGVLCERDRWWLVRRTCTNKLVSGRPACTALPLDRCPCRERPAPNAGEVRRGE